MALIIEDDILRLEVSIDDVLGVKVLESEQHFSDDELGHHLIDDHTRSHVLRQIAIGTVISHQVQMTRSLHREVLSTWKEQ